MSSDTTGNNLNTGGDWDGSYAKDSTTKDVRNNTPVRWLPNLATAIFEGRADVVVPRRAAPPTEVPATSADCAAQHHAEGSALPSAISVQPIEGRILAWKGRTPPSKRKLASSLPEEEQAALLGFAATSVRSESWPGSSICIREVDVGVDPSLMREASKADQAIFLAMSTVNHGAVGQFMALNPDSDDES